jgi:hypothetical protein
MKIISNSLKVSSYKLYFITKDIQISLLALLEAHIGNAEICATIVFLLAALVHRNPDAVNRVAHDNCLGLMAKVLEKHMDHAGTIEGAASFMSNATYRNDSVKIRIGNRGMVDLLMRILERQVAALSSLGFRSQTLKQVLRALGNSSLILANAKEIVRNRYQTHMQAILAKLNFSN